MASGRMIHICISISEKINDLSLKDAFIYTWLIPHLDDYARMSGSPRTIKALVFPLKKEITVEDIEEALKKFKGLKLFLWEKVENELVLQQPIEEFNLYQNIYYRKKSKFKEILINSNNFLEIKKNSNVIDKIRIDIDKNRLDGNSNKLLENQETPKSIKEIIKRLETK